VHGPREYAMISEHIGAWGGGWGVSCTKVKWRNLSRLFVTGGSGVRTCSRTVRPSLKRPRILNARFNCIFPYRELLHRTPGSVQVFGVQNRVQNRTRSALHWRDKPCGENLGFFQPMQCFVIAWRISEFERARACGSITLYPIGICWI
jgi:hypothetical protein